MAYVLGHDTVARLEKLAILAAILLGIAFSLWGGIVYSWLTSEVIVDKRMEAGCVLPRHNGEATFFLITDGELKCWRYK